jgi:C-terminal processing protease CtpA/Prc
MNKFSFRLVIVLVLLALLSLACMNPFANRSPNTLYEITGTFEYTNEFYPEEYAYEHAVSLLDMSAFVERDHDWEIPVGSQVLGYLDMDTEKNIGQYTIQLPIQPAGQHNDVDHDGKPEAGLQVFAVEYTPNWTGGPYYSGDDFYLGWPSYLASVTVDRENQDEVTGGKVVVWSPNDTQDFPTGFGEDGLLFTDDDPTASLLAGWSVIDLDQDPFEVIRDPSHEITLYEPEDAAVKDFSDLGFSEAFEKMFDIASKEYAFNGFEGKAPDWDALHNDLAPRVQQAEDDKDAYAFYLVLRDFAHAFKDGHVGLDGGDNEGAFVQSEIIGGFGLAVRELDDGEVVVVYVLPDGPADEAGIEVGATLNAVDGTPVSEAIGQVAPFAPQSTDFGLRYEQTVFLLRAGPGDSITLDYTNPGGSDQDATLTAIREVDSLFATYGGGDTDPYALPVEYRLHEDIGVGYVRINSNSDDLNLSYRIFLRALDIFEAQGMTGLVIDMRNNYGGTNLGLAGYLHDEEILMGQLEYYSDRTGQFEPEGDLDKVYPMDKQYDFDKIVLLVDQFCYSACELESFGFSQVPEVVVMGQFPTAGVEAETARGKFLLPGEMELTIPTGRFLLPDGSIFLEGQGVPPEVVIPVTRESVLSDVDVVLLEALEAASP